MIKGVYRVNMFRPFFSPAHDLKNPAVLQGTPVRYSKAVQLVHEFSGALLCIDVQERAAIEGFAMKVVLKTVEPPSGKRGGDYFWVYRTDIMLLDRIPMNKKKLKRARYDFRCMMVHRSL